VTDGIYAFDLLVPVRPLLPGVWTCSCGAILGPYTPLRHCRTKPDAHAGCRAKAEAERTARATAEFDAAIAAWRQVCDQYADTPAVLAVLNLHQPTLGHASAECDHCEQYDGMEGTEQAPWPCPTYAAVRDAPDRSDVDACNDVPVKAEALPKVGETVHVWAKDGAPGCTPMHVVGYLGGRVIPAAGLYLQGFCATAASPIRRYSSPSHDETRTEPCSWHYPCGGDGRDAEPEPDAPGPVSVTINVSGSVLSERDLADTLRKIIRQDMARNPSYYRL
jgi:hypothetical protein